MNKIQKIELINQNIFFWETGIFNTYLCTTYKY